MPEITSSADANDVVLRSSIDRSLRHPVMFFFTSGALWLAIAAVLGLIASAKKHMPEFLEGCSLFDAGKIDAAHINALVYGWGFQAAFGMIIWLMARLSRKECTSSGLILTAGHIWNGAVLVGVACIMMGQGTGVPWMEFPTFVWPVLLLSYILITIWSLIQFQVRDAGHVYVSQWYLLAAMLWFPWIYFTANVFVFGFEGGNPLMAAGIASWFKGTLFLLFFLPVAIASAYFLAPKVTGRPVYSYNIALFGFWSLAVVGPWAGMQKLTGAPIPQFLPYVGAAAMVLILIPAIAVGWNILNTVSGHAETVTASPSLRFTAAGIIGLLVFGVLSAATHLFGFELVQFSYTGYGFDILGIYGVFSLCAFGAIYFVVPRITRREWLSRRFISWHFYLSLYGTISVVICAIVGGLSQGEGIEAWNQSFLAGAGRAQMYGWGVTLAWGFLLLSNLFFCLHLLLMWARLGRRSSHPTLLNTHHADSPHGPEGEVDNYGSATA
ncbi:MAG: cbb3-type cytochrome c oxidase subunit I [Akkermansiaceae bacterium]|nr:cbb3-type cytochrome c oxidase subunit I [bacterium]